MNATERTRKLRNVALVSLGCGLAIALAGCAALRREFSTPLRGSVPEEKYNPPPPKDLLFVAVKAAKIPPKTRDGRSWDSIGGSAPDVYAVLFADGKEILRTVTVPNTLRPAWPRPAAVNLRIPHAAKVHVELWDDNALVSHPICNQPIHNLEEAAEVGETEIECDSGATVVMTVEPPKARLGIGLFYEMRGKEAYVSRLVAASSAGRAGLQPGDRIVTVEGKMPSTMTEGELESVFNARSRLGVVVEVQGSTGVSRKVTLRDEPMYPAKGEGVELVDSPDAPKPAE